MTLAIVARILLALWTPGNIDAEAYGIVAGIVRDGGNVYAETFRYNYGPPWAYLVAGFDVIAAAIGVPLIVIVRFFLTGIDVATALLLNRLGSSRAAMLFLLNPVSILITGFHGQFDNLAMLLLLASFIAAPWAIASVLVKHITGPLLLYLPHRPLPLMAGAVAALGLSLVPFALTGGLHGITQNVIGYGSIAGEYGLTMSLPREVVFGMLGIALFAGSILTQRWDPRRRLLAGVLVFLVFTPGWAGQYAVLPIAVGALVPSMGLLVYTAAATVYLLGAPLEIALISAVSAQIVWLAAVVWVVLLVAKHGLHPLRQPVAHGRRDVHVRVGGDRHAGLAERASGGPRQRA